MQGGRDSKDRFSCSRGRSFYARRLRVRRGSCVALETLRVLAFEMMNKLLVATGTEAMITDPYSLSAFLTDSLKALRGEKRRYFGEGWGDWEGQSTGVTGAVVYCLWVGFDASQPEYIGETTNLGPRLFEHFAAPGWDPTPTYVSYFRDERLADPAIRILLERFAIAALRPNQNSPYR